MTSIALILLHWNNTSEVTALIEELLEVKISNVDMHCVIVDNGSSTAQVQILQSLEGRAHLIYSTENLGYAGGNNLGIKHALSIGSDMVVLMNSDIVFDQKQFKGLIEDVIASEKVAIAGPVIIENDKRYAGGRNIAKGLNTRIRLEAVRQSLNNRNWLDVEYIPGTFIIIRSEVFRTVGVLDEAYFFSGEIADFCHRALGAQVKVCVNKNYSIQHETGNNKRREGLYLYYNLRNRFLFVSKFFPKLRWTWFVRGSRFAFGALMRLNFKRFRTTVIAVFHGMTDKFGNSNHLFN